MCEDPNKVPYMRNPPPTRLPYGSVDHGSWIELPSEDPYWGSAPRVYKVLFWVTVVVTTVAISILVWASFAYGRDVGQIPPNLDPAVRKWFQSLKSNAGGFCCDVADGHRTEYDIRGTSYWVPIEGKWWPVPPDTVIYDAGNPFGEAVVWYSTTWGEDGAYEPKIRCFVPGGGV